MTEQDHLTNLGPVGLAYKASLKSLASPPRFQRYSSSHEDALSGAYCQQSDACRKQPFKICVENMMMGCKGLIDYSPKAPLEQSSIQ